MHTNLNIGYYLLYNTYFFLNTKCEILHKMLKSLSDEKVIEPFKGSHHGITL